MNELFPFISGLTLGAVLALVRPRTHPLVAVAACVVLGALATIISGEYKISPAFLLIDIPLVAVASAASFAGIRALRRRGRRGLQG